MSLTELFCDVDDFCQRFEAQWQREQLGNSKQRFRAGQLCLSEIMTILIHFHQSHYRNFKSYYTAHVQPHLGAEFPRLVSYERFVQLIPSILVPLCAYLQHCYGRCSGIGFIDSTALAVCDNRRIHQHRVFADSATRGKTTMGWFFGFKLHLVVNDRGELLTCRLTPGNVDDRVPVPKLTEQVWGKLFGDKGYLSQPLAAQLRQRDLHLVTKLKSNMKNRLLPLMDKLLLRKRSIIESITDQLKNISQIEHTRHRSLTNFMVNLLCGLIAYSHQPKKPSLHLSSSLLLEDLIHN
jgi:hypothetical protein